MGVGAYAMSRGWTEIGLAAFAAGAFHLMTHAFFKALLFLGSGSVIHAMAGEQDMRRMGGLRRYLPVTYMTMMIGTLAIAGIPPLAGFFSKDEILFRTFLTNKPIWVFAVVTALMTAFYMFRLLWLAFLTPSRMARDVEARVHESPLSMTGVLVLLAALSAVGGFIAVPHFLEPQLALPPLHESLHAAEQPLLWISVALALAGLALAAALYAGRGERAQRLAAALTTPHRWLLGKFYVDELYERLLGAPLVWLSDRVLLRVSDRLLIDGALHGATAIGRLGAALLGRLQTGSLQVYAWFVLIGIAGALWWGVRHV
jgi:NADH-quinone oxidoreductase subunit L